MSCVRMFLDMCGWTPEVSGEGSLMCVGTAFRDVKGGLLWWWVVRAL